MISSPRNKLSRNKLSSNKSSISSQAIFSFFTNALKQETIYLLPLRLFIGIGWLRAGLEKWLEPTWHNGSSLSTFLQSHVASNTVVFPFYEQLVLNTFEPSSFILSYIIIIGQFLVGIALITGTFTNLALLGGIFMNVNFILIGEPVPSTFYIVIQLVLLLSHIGHNFGVDSLLAKRIPYSFLVAQPSDKRYSKVERAFIRTTVLTLLLTAFMLIPHIHDFSPASVDDPAMILFILSMFATAFLLLSLIQSSLQPEKVIKKTTL